MSNPHAPQLYLISYDIRDDKRWRQVYKAMRGQGDRVQYSVFRCVLTERRLAELADKLSKAISHTEDQVLIVPLGSAEADRSWRMETIGQPLVVPERVVKIF